jgi:hypothetical protein
MTAVAEDRKGHEKHIETQEVRKGYWEADDEAI